MIHEVWNIRKDTDQNAHVSLTLTALLQGCALFVTASGLLSTALSLQAGTRGLPSDVIGLIMSAYFLGFIVGTYLCPGVISAVGHIRAFSVFAAVAAAASGAHALVFGFVSWSVLRLLTGICLAGLYMVAESWLNEQSDNSVRGRIFAVYQIISLSGLAVGQWLLLLESSNLSAPFLIGAILFALGLVPTALARVKEPEPVPRVHLDLRHLWSVSPLGVLGAFAAAAANGVFFSLGPVFASAVGMPLARLAAFMSAVIFGGALLQWPIGHLSDRFDRRRIIFAASTASALLAALAVLTLDRSISLFYVSAFLYGGFTFSVYPLCVAHSNDNAAPGDHLRTASGLLLIYGAGATIGPAVAGLVMGRLGAGAFFVFLMAVYGGVSLFIVYRMLARPQTAAEQEPFVMLNRTSQSALSLMPAAADDASPAQRQDASSAGEQH